MLEHLLHADIEPAKAEVGLDGGLKKKSGFVALCRTHLVADPDVVGEQGGTGARAEDAKMCIGAVGLLHGIAHRELLTFDFVELVIVVFPGIAPLVVIVEQGGGLRLRKEGGAEMGMTAHQEMKAAVNAVVAVAIASGDLLGLGIKGEPAEAEARSGKEGCREIVSAVDGELQPVVFWSQTDKDDEWVAPSVAHVGVIGPIDFGG